MLAELYETYLEDLWTRRLYAATPADYIDSRNNAHEYDREKNTYELLAKLNNAAYPDGTMVKIFDEQRRMTSMSAEAFKLKEADARFDVLQNPQGPVAVKKLRVMVSHPVDENKDTHKKTETEVSHADETPEAKRARMIKELTDDMAQNDLKRRNTFHM